MTADPPASASPVRSRVGLAAWGMLAVLIVLYILNALDRSILSLVVGPVKEDLAISDFQMSLLLGVAFALFYALCGIPIGWMVDRWPRRWILYGGVTVWSLATLFSGLAANYHQLLGARMLLGVSEATLGPAAHSLIADRFPKSRLALALSLFTAGAVIGTGGSIIIGGLATGYFSQFETIAFPVLGHLRPWQAVFACIGLPGLLLAFLVFTFREPPRTHVTTGPAAPVMPFLRANWRLVGCMLGAFGLHSMIVQGSLAWMPTFMQRTYDWTPAQIGPALGIVNIVSAGVGTIGGGLIVDWLASRGRRDAHLRVFLIALAVGTPIGAFGFLSPDPTVFLACVFLLKMLSFSFIGYGAAAVQSITPPRLRGRMAALYLLSLVLVGSAGGPSLIAFFTDFVFGDPARLGWSIAASIAVITPVVLVLAWLGLRPMREAVEQRLIEDQEPA